MLLMLEDRGTECLDRHPDRWTPPSLLLGQFSASPHEGHSGSWTRFPGEEGAEAVSQEQAGRGRGRAEAGSFGGDAGPQ